MHTEHKQLVVDSFRQIIGDGDSWLWGDRIVERKRHSVSTTAEVLYSDESYYYSISDVPDLPLATIDLLDDGPVRMVYDFPSQFSASWTLGGAIFRAQYIPTAKQGVVSQEADTLKWIQNRGDLGIATPRMLHEHTRFDREFTIRTALPGQLTGQRVADKWILLTDKERSELCEKIMQVYVSMAKYTSRVMTGADGRWLGEWRLAGCIPHLSFDPRMLKAVCSEELKMDCTELVLHPCGLNPGLLVMMPDGSLGMTEFDSIGYVPRAWVTTYMGLFMDEYFYAIEYTEDLKYCRRRHVEGRASGLEYIQGPSPHATWFRMMMPMRALYKHALVALVQDHKYPAADTKPYRHWFNRLKAKVIDQHRPKVYHTEISILGEDYPRVYPYFKFDLPILSKGDLDLWRRFMNREDPYTKVVFYPDTTNWKQFMIKEDLDLLLN